ncbi:MAG: hypothetical protein II916_06460 [Oscillospiraceae bacterium]|nr:hypothetical protein [Oscillospiraceae bacterium]
MNFKWNAMTAAVLSLCLLTGCGGGETVSIDPADIAGTWVNKADGASETLTIRSDGTYHKTVDVGSSYPKTEVDDSWSLEGADVTIYISEYNTAFTYTVAVSEDKNTMVWDNGDNRIVYTKKK